MNWYDYFMFSLWVFNCYAISCSAENYCKNVRETEILRIATDHHPELEKFKPSVKELEMILEKTKRRYIWCIGFQIASVVFYCLPMVIHLWWKN